MIMIRRLVPLLFLLIILPLTLSAQRAFLENTFVSVSVGANTSVNDNLGLMDKMGGHLSLGVGYHLSNSITFRGQLMPMLNAGPSGNSSLYLYAHVDMLWNVFSSLAGYNPNRTFALSPFYGFGVVHGSGDNDFTIVAGLQASQRVGTNTHLFGEIKAMCHPSEFDGNTSTSFAPMVSAGVCYNINENAYSNKNRPDNPTASSDWWVGFGALGFNSFQYKGIESFGQRLRQVAPAAEVAFGKTINPYWSGRVEITGLQSRLVNMVENDLKPEPVCTEEIFAFFNFHADIMFNASNLFLRQAYLPKVSVHPYLGAGLLVRTDYISEKRFSINGGLFTRFIVSAKSDLFFDLKYALTESRFAHVSYDQGRFSVGTLTGSIGYIYNLGTSRCRKIR